MVLHDVMSELEKLGTEQNRKVYARHGARPDMFGVSYANLGKLKRRIKSDHGLAVGLWNTGNHDACVLATMITDPNEMDTKTLGKWVSDLDSYVITDAFAKLAVRIPDIDRHIEKWISSDKEWISAAGWQVFAGLLPNKPDIPDDFLKDKLRVIEKHIHLSKNRTKYAMNSALMSIGIYRESLRDDTIEAARRIGKVDVDHGETGCKTPDAESYILKAGERSSKSNK